MADKLTYKLFRKEDSHSKYDWLNIDLGTARIGRVRGNIRGNTLTICSINIFPEFERHGYAKEIIKLFKESHSTIIADRVRPMAIGFWIKMGFVTCGNGNYIWEEPSDRRYKNGVETSGNNSSALLRLLL